MHRKFRKIIDIFLTDLSFNPFAKCKISEERSSFNIGSSPDQRVLQIKNNIFEKIGESFWKLQNIREALPDQRVKLTVIIGLEFAPESNLCNFTLILTVKKKYWQWEEQKGGNMYWTRSLGSSFMPLQTPAAAVFYGLGWVRGKEREVFVGRDHLFLL